MRVAKRLVSIIALLLLVLFFLLISTRIMSSLREQDAASVIAPPTGQYVETDLGDIFVQSYGPEIGQPILLVHGTAAWSGLWEQTSVFLAGLGYRVYALDLPPFGFSERPVISDYGRSQQASRIRALLVSLKVKKAILVGHSFGSGAAVEAVMQDSALFAGLVLIDAALGLTPTADTADLPLLLKAEWLREIIVSATVTNPMTTKYLLASLLHKKERALPEYVEVLQRPLTIEGSTQAVSQWLPYLLLPDTNSLSAHRNEYRSIHIPVEIIWGVEDNVTPLAQERDIQSLINGASLTTLPDVGHIPQIENPEVFQQTLSVALKQIDNKLPDDAMSQSN